MVVRAGAEVNSHTMTTTNPPHLLPELISKLALMGPASLNAVHSFVLRSISRRLRTGGEFMIEGGCRIDS